MNAKMSKLYIVNGLVNINETVYYQHLSVSFEELLSLLVRIE